MSEVIVCTPAEMHPYNCGGPGGLCVHCLHRRTKEHDPEFCVLCHFDDKEWLERYERLMAKGSCR